MSRPAQAVNVSGPAKIGDVPEIPGPPMNRKPVVIVEANLACPEHQEATLQMLNAYALDPMGDGKALSETARRDVIPGLRRHPTTLVFLA